MREIRQSGSEGGAVMSRPYPYREVAFDNKSLNLGFKGGPSTHGVQKNPGSS